MKASARRARRADVMRRRCPDCRNSNLTILEGVWCEACGRTGPVKDFPYQNCYAPKEGK